MEWGQLKNFMWLWILPLVFFIFYFSNARKNSQMSRFGDIALIQRLVTSFDPFKRTLKRVCMILSIFFIILALCQPHFRTKETIVERKGIDVMIAIDVSRSMLAKDIAPNRLEKAKLELSTLIDRLKGDRIGIVAFAGEAYIQCPLTLDRSAVKLFLSTVSPDLIPLPGTMIGPAIQVATQAFTEKEKEFKALILLTDGEDQGSNPLQATKKAKQAGVRIFTIGIGTPDGSTIPGELTGESFKKDRQGRVVLSKLDEKLLKQIANETGGAYYRATRGEFEIDAIAVRISQMTQKGLKTEKSIEYEENYQYFLVLALLFLFAEMILSERKRTVKNGRSLALFFLLTLTPFLFGFNFLSSVKNERGNSYYKKGQLGKAKTSYESALKSEPKSGEIAFNLGNAYYKQGLFDKALETFKNAAKAIKAPFDQSKVFYNLGNSLFRREELEKAIDFYKQALRLNPKDEDAKYNLELLNKKLEQKKEEQKKPDQKKDQKKDQQKDQQKQDQQQQNQQQKDQNKDQSQQNQENQQQQKDQQSQGGQSDKEKEEQKQNEQKKQGEQEEKQGQQQKGEQSKEEGEQGEQQPESQGLEEKEESQGEQQKQEEQQAAAGQEEAEQPQGQEEKQVPMTAEEIRAGQILDALQDQEKQVFKMQRGGNQSQRAQARRMVEKDW